MCVCVACRSRATGRWEEDELEGGGHLCLCV